MAATADPWLLAADLLDPPTDELDGDPRARWHRDIRGIYVPHDPHPPQERFLWLDCFEAFYGGAAGGGKSDALLMAALAYVDVPGYAAILFRRTFPDLNQPGALIPRSKEWLSKSPARWHGGEHRWTFPSGATLTFGHLQREDDKLQYQGAEFQFAGFDEQTQFTETQFAYLASRLRRPEYGPLSRVPLRLRGAGNPGGPGHKWTKRRSVDRIPNPDDPEDTLDDCAARVFVPAKLSDNPSIDQNSYTESLGALDPQTRKQLLDGDWNARAAGDWVFPNLDPIFKLGAEHTDLLAAGKMTPPVGSQLYIAADWGVHSHILILWPLEAGGFFVPYEVVYQGDSVWDAAQPVADLIKHLGYPVHEERFDASMPGLNAAFMRELRPKLPMMKMRHLAIPFNKFKALSYDYLRLLAHNTAAEPAKHPRLSISERGCPVLADQLRGLQYADPDAGRIEKGDDHGPDALCAGAAPAAARR